MTTTTADPILEGRILDRMQQWKSTFEAKDVDGIMSFYADGRAFSAFDLMPPMEFRGGPMWRDNWVSFFGAFQGPPDLEFAHVEVHASADLAVVRLLTRLQGVMFGRPLDMWVRQTNCFRLIDGEWLMVHDHVSVPTDFATGRALTDLAPPVAGVTP